MSKRTFDRLLGCSLFFMAWWFFGNIYEEITMVPNHLTDTYKTLAGYVDYFHFSNPIIYFVPFTQLAVVILVILYLRCDDLTQKHLLGKASVYGITALILTVVIVTQINVKIFSPDFHQFREQLYSLSVWWLAGNALRIFLVGRSAYFALQTFMLRAK